MFQRRRLKKIHAKFLESCRNLKEGRQYLDQATGFKRFVLETLCPVPLLALHEEGEHLLKALRWLEDHRRAPLQEQTLRDYHRMIYKGGAEPAGEYRRGRVSVVGSSIPRPAPERIPALMKQLELRVTEAQRKFDGMDRTARPEVVKVAVDLYQRIGLIHPFADANGRVARLAMNHLLRRYDLSYVILPPLGEAPELMAALQEAHRGNAGPLEAIAERRMFRV
jgi:Fic family protein